MMMHFQNFMRDNNNWMVDSSLSAPGIRPRTPFLGPWFIYLKCSISLFEGANRQQYSFVRNLKFDSVRVSYITSEDSINDAKLSPVHLAIIANDSFTSSTKHLNNSCKATTESSEIHKQTRCAVITVQLFELWSDVQIQPLHLLSCWPTAKC